MMTEQDLLKIKERVDNASLWTPWQVCLDMHPDGFTVLRVRDHVRPAVAWSNHYREDYGKTFEDPDGYLCWIEFPPNNMQAKAEFIAHASAAVPALVAEVERLRAALGEIAGLAPGRQGECKAIAQRALGS